MTRHTVDIVPGPMATRDAAATTPNHAVSHPHRILFRCFEKWAEASLRVASWGMQQANENEACLAMPLKACAFCFVSTCMRDPETVTLASYKAWLVDMLRGVVRA